MLRSVGRCVLLFAVVFVVGCGGGGDGNNALTENPSISDHSTVINLKEGGFAGTAGAGVYFPPQDTDLSLEVTVNGGGTSSADPLIVTGVPIADAGESTKAASAGSSGVVFYPFLTNASGTSLPGTYMAISVDGSDLYTCSGVAAGSGTRIEGAVLGADGRQYVGCVKVPDDFTANFFIDENSVIETNGDLAANISVVGPICADKDCGELAVPIDMPRLFAAYEYERNPSGTFLLTNTLNNAVLNLMTFMAEDTRRDAYESMLKELLLQRYLWQEYGDKIQELSGEDAPGMLKWLQDVSEMAETYHSVEEGGKTLIQFTPGLLSAIRASFGWSKYATYANVLNKIDGYLGPFDTFVDTTVLVDRGFFELTLYQLLANAFVEDYIYQFEAKILPNVKDPALVKAFRDVKKDFLGDDPSSRSGGLLYSSFDQYIEAAKTVFLESSYILVKSFAGKQLTTGMISTGIGAGAAAAYGFPPAAIPAVLATIAISAADDQFEFDFEKKILTALATFIHNTSYDFELFDENCPATDDEKANLVIAENMFYGARLFFSLIKNSYDRWFIGGQLTIGDMLPGLAEMFGIDQDGHIWTGPRQAELGAKDVKYSAKSVKALGIMFGCDIEAGGGCTCFSGPCCDGCDYRPSTYVCDTQSELSCHWGNTCGSDVAQRTQDRYCSGTSSSCGGDYGAWSDYSVATDCATNQNCSTVPSVPACALNLACGTCAHACAVGQTRCESGRLYSCTTDASGCRIWDAGTACTTGRCSTDGLSCDTCSHACTIGQTMCSSGRVYNCTTNASGCRVWDAGSACSSGTCTADGLRCAGCTSHDHNACYDHDVYSYDSCGVRESLVTDCGVGSWTGTTFCQSNDVYQNFITRDCLSGGCTTSTPAATKKEECDDAGCSGGVCCSDHASLRCSGSSLYWYSGCNNRQDLEDDCSGSTPVGSNYCSDNDVYRDFDVGACTTDHCTTSRQPIKQTECGTGGCSGGACCTTHASRRCDSGDVYYFNSCGTREGVATDCDATQTCSVDRCVCPTSTPWTSNTLTATVVSGGVRLTWNAAPSSWIHHYVVTAMPGADTPPPGMSISGNLTTTTFTHTGGTHGQRYTYLVYGYDSCGANRNTSSLTQATFP